MAAWSLQLRDPGGHLLTSREVVLDYQDLFGLRHSEYVWSLRAKEMFRDAVYSIEGSWPPERFRNEANLRSE